MKKLFLLLILVLSAATMFADDVTLEQALQTARQFAKHEAAKQPQARRALATSNPQLVYSEKSKIVSKDNVYVINFGNDQGFVVVSGESGTSDEILGYCDHGAFEYDNCPPQLKDLLKNYANVIDKVRENPSFAAKRRASAVFPDYIGTIIVGPLLTTTWSQHGPYNDLCPKGCPTGCYPTALAQVMNYWKWPKVTRGKVKVDVDSQGEYVYEDFAGRTYDWDNILDNYGQSITQNGWFGKYTSYNDEQAEAVAHLMADIGKAFGTMYYPEGSLTHFVREPLIDNFGYEPGIKIKKGVTAAELQEDLKAELNEKRPVLYCGFPSLDTESGGDGHALVCDGYTDRDYFHFNYGWGGYYDGFYKNALIPLFQFAAIIFTGVRPYDAEFQVVDGIKYALMKNGTAEVLEYTIGEMGRESGEVVIPATVTDGAGNSYKVTRLRKDAFYNKGHFTKVTIGDNVEIIEPFCFIQSTIDEVVLSDKVKEVGDEAFQLANVNKLTIGASIERIGKKAFYLCPLSTVICKSPAFVVDERGFSNPSGGYIDSGEWLNHITKIGFEGFAGHYFRTAPDFAQLEEIGSRAFAGSKFPENEFVVPSKLKHISPDAFDVSGLSYFLVKDNPNFLCSPYTQFFLCNSNGTSLMMTPPITKMGVLGDGLTPFPETLVKMEPSSVRNNVNVIIPQTIIDMEGAYKDVTKLSYLRCMAVVPPEITDETFNDKIFENDPILYVPMGTAELYQNAPGWRRFNRIFDELEYIPMEAQGKQYYMVVNSTDEEKQQRVNIPVNEIKSMEVSDDGKQVIIKRNGKEDLTTSVTAIDSIAWMPGFVYENAEIFDINENNLTVEAQKCKVRFDPTVIDGDVQLCVRNSVLTPKIMEDVVSGFTIDLSLSDGRHELSGTVDITVPMTYNPERQAGVAYFNEETGEWEPVYFEQNKETGAITLSTNHLSAYAIFEVAHTNTRYTKLNIFEEVPQLYILNEACKKLLNIMSSDDPEVEMKWQYKSEMSLWQSAGLDVLYNAANGTLEAVLGYKPFAEEIDNAVTAMGYLGTALNILDVARADLKGDDVGVAAGTLNTILSHVTGQMASAIGTPIMSVSMAGVAAIGIALNKFGEKVAQSKLDFFRLAYSIYYGKEGYYRTAKDWYNYFYPAFEKGGMTADQLNAYLEQSVRNYCYKFWEDDDERAFCIAEAESRASSMGISTWQWETESLRQQISDEYYSELMHGVLVSVFQAIRNHMKVEAYNRYASAAKSVAALVNRQIGLQILDKSVKEGEKSKYAGYTIRFSYMPESLLSDEYLNRTINEQGRCKIGYFTEYALILNDMPTRLTLIDPKGKEVADYPFQIANKKGTQVIEIDLSTGGVEVENPKLEGLELQYDPAVVTLPVTYSGYDYTYDLDGNLTKYLYGADTPSMMPIPLDNSYNKKANFQVEVEKFLHRHEFITVDESGNVKLGDDISTKFEGNEAKAKFKINTSCLFAEKSKEQYVKEFNEFWDPKSELDGTALLNLLDGTIAHKIDGEVTITRDIENGGYDVTYIGSGTFIFDCKNVSLVDNVNYAALKANEKLNVTVDDLTIADSHAEGKVTLKYSTKITP